MSLKSLFGSSAIYVLGATAARGARFLLIPIYVRTLTPADVGIIVVLEAVMFALTRFFSMALSQSVKRYYTEYEDQRDADNFVAAIWWLGTAVALAIGTVLAIIAFNWGHLLSEQVLPLYLTLAVIAAVLKSNFSILLERYIVRGEAARHSYFNVLQFLSSAALTIYFIVGRNMGVSGLLYAEIASGLLWNVIAIRVLGAWPLPRWPREQMERAVRYSLPALPHALFTWGITFSDRIILERMVPLAQVAIYGIGYQLASAVPTMSLALVNAWIPRFFRTAGAEQGRQDFNRVFTIQMAAIVGVAISVFVFGREVISILATSAYLPAVPILQVVAIGLIFHGAYQALLLPLFYAQRTRWVSIATGIAFAINITTNLLLIPRIGIMGAALATVFAYVGTTFVVWAVAKKSYGIQLEYGRLIEIAVLAAIAAGISLVATTGRVVVDLPLKVLALAIYFVPIALIIRSSLRAARASRTSAPFRAATVTASADPAA